VSLLQSEIPAHAHALRANNNNGDTPSPGGNSLARTGTSNTYQQNSSASLTPMAPESLTPAGGDQPHNNMMPYLTFYFCIALQGVFPPRS
jgi:microcystin-dependent protein